MKIKNIKIEHVLSALIMLLPLLRLYGISIAGKSISCAIVLMIFVSVYSIFKIIFLKNNFVNNEMEVRINKHEFLYLLFWIYTFIISVLTVNYYRLGYPLDTYLQVFCMLIIITVFRKVGFNLNVALNAYYLSGILCSVLVVFQAVQLVLTGSMTYFVNRALIRTVRPSGLFLEPAHFCVYVTPLLYLLLFYFSPKNNTKNLRMKKIIGAGLISIAIIFSRGGLGLILLAYIWGLWFKSNKTVTRVNPKVKIAALVVFSAGLFIVGIKGDWLTWSLNHVFELGGDGVSSGGFRIFRGHYVFSALPMIHKIGGIGQGTSGQIIEMFNIKTPLDGLHVGSDYMSSFYQVFVFGGLIGGLLFGGFMVLFYAKSYKVTRYLLVIYIIDIIVNENLFTASLIILLLICFSLNDKSNHRFFERINC